MELLEALGDATVVLEIFDAVAFVIQVLVKRRFIVSVLMQVYDGDASELFHISTEESLSASTNSI